MKRGPIRPPMGHQITETVQPLVPCIALAIEKAFSAGPDQETGGGLVHRGSYRLIRLGVGAVSISRLCNNSLLQSSRWAIQVPVNLGSAKASPR